MNTTSELLAKECVNEGAAILDTKMPSWYLKIDLDSLEMDNGCKCVLGQIGGNPVNLDRLSWDESVVGVTKKEVHDWEGVEYDTMIEILNIPNDVKYGFIDGSVLRRGKPVLINYDDLQKAWTEEILRRRNVKQ